MTDFKKLKVAELRSELASRGLPLTGKRDELIERLEEHDFEQGGVDEGAGDEGMEMDIVQESAADALPVHQPEDHQPTISPIIAPSLPLPALDVEEEKRRARALRFGLDISEIGAVSIEVTVRKLEHALPNRHRGHGRKGRHHARRQVTINKP